MERRRWVVLLALAATWPGQQAFGWGATGHEWATGITISARARSSTNPLCCRSRPDGPRAGPLDNHNKALDQRGIGFATARQKPNILFGALAYSQKVLNRTPKGTARDRLSGWLWLPKCDSFGPPQHCSFYWS